MKKILKWLDINAEAAVGGVLFCVVLVIITVQIFMRNILGHGVQWAEEICRFLYVWMCYIGLSYATRMNTHITIDVVRKKLPEKVQRVIIILIQAIFLGLFVVLFSGALSNVIKVYELNGRAESINISQNWMYIAAPIGYGLSVIRLVQTFIWKVRYFNCSTELFMDEAGVYSGSIDTFCYPEETREELREELSKKALQEKEERHGRRGGNK